MSYQGCLQSHCLQLLVCCTVALLIFSHLIYPFFFINRFFSTHSCLILRGFFFANMSLSRSWLSLMRGLQLMMRLNGIITDIQAVERWWPVSSICDWAHTLQDPSHSTKDLWLAKKKNIKQKRDGWLLRYHLCDLEEKCIITLNEYRK